MKLISPRSSESVIPLVVITRRVKFQFFLQARSPFGLLIQIPFLIIRWGSA